MFRTGGETNEREMSSWNEKHGRWDSCIVGTDEENQRKRKV